MSHDDFDFEPQPGLPAPLPQGENLLWQGSPDWQSLALRAYHVRKVALYFSLLVVLRLTYGFATGNTGADMLVSCGLLILFGSIAIGLLSLLAFFSARATVYSVTSKRVLLRHGVAVPMTMNVPLKLIDGASLKVFGDKTGDIALALPRDQRIGYLITWPHVRPGSITRPQPSLRSLGNPEQAANVLGAALAAQAGVAATPVEAAADAVPQGVPAFVPHGVAHAAPRGVPHGAAARTAAAV